MGKKFEKIGEFATKGSEYAEKGKTLLHVAAVVTAFIGMLAKMLSKK